MSSLKEITVLDKEKNVIVHLFKEGNEFKAIVDDDFELIIKKDDLPKDKSND